MDQAILKKKKLPVSLSQHVCELFFLIFKTTYLW